MSDGIAGPDDVLGVVPPRGFAMGGVVEPLERKPRPAVEDRERLARLAAEIFMAAGVTPTAGELIVLAAWLGGVD